MEMLPPEQEPLGPETESMRHTQLLDRFVVLLTKISSGSLRRSCRDAPADRGRRHRHQVFSKPVPAASR